LAVVLVATVLVLVPPTHAVAALPTSHCAYMETDQGTELGQFRVSLFNRQVGCDRAITVVRSFLSFLPRRHHGGRTPGESWWTMPSQPGWRCGVGAGGGACEKGGARAEYEIDALSGPEPCSNVVRFRIGGVSILSWRHVGCGLRRRIARSVGADLMGHSRDHGFRCRELPLRAGGGGALCRRGGRFVELGFE